ncbi:MAG: VWA domain-containing protein [Candidatus Sulfotelmatobacter sp.]
MTTLRCQLCRLQLSFAIALIAVAATAQTAQPATEPPAPTIRVTTHMVLVDVVVTDKQGKAITGLHPEDFVVEENGKQQKISSLVTPAENAPPQAPQLPPGIYSNRSQYRSPGKAITVLLLDALNTPFTDQAYARRQMLEFVKQQFKPGEHMAIFTLTGPLHVLQDFTTDPQILQTALQAYKPQQQTLVGGGQPATSNEPGGSTPSSTVTTLDASTAAPSDSGTPGSIDFGRGGGGGGAAAQSASVAQAALQSFEGAQVAYAKDQWAVLTLNALNSLSRILGGMPGRKNLIWVTGDLPFSFIPENRTMNDAELAEALPSLNTRRVGEHSAGNYAETFRQSHAEEIRETASRLASAQVAVYPVDARGLSLSLDNDAQETMREMARETGGRAYVNQNEIKVGVQRAVDDEFAAYTLGYYPDNKKYDGKYRQIKVKVKRDGVELQNRRGYYAIDPTLTKGYNPQMEVVSALGDIVPSTLVAFTAQVKPPSVNSAKGKIGVTFLVDANTLSAEDSAGGKHLNVSMYATVYSPGGKMLTTGSQKVDQSFDASTYQKILQQGLMLHMDLDPQPGGNQIRLAVQDGRTGLVGTIDAPAPTP